ncbi:hypothetical protein MTO96_026613 [Rhipicephalus appendiculatus]
MLCRDAETSRSGQSHVVTAPNRSPSDFVKRCCWGHIGPPRCDGVRMGVVGWSAAAAARLTRGQQAAQGPRHAVASAATLSSKVGNHRYCGYAAART